MKRTANLIFSSLLIVVCAACTNEIYEFESNNLNVRRDSTVAITMQLQANVTPFTVDNGTTRAANEWTWQNDAVIYLQLFNGSTRISSYAVYNNNRWEIPILTGSIGKNDKCEVYYFEGVPNSNKTSVQLGNDVGSYADRNAHYVFENGVVNISASLQPLTSRIRFLKASGTSISKIEVEGITINTTYDVMTNTFNTNNEVICANVGSTGYTPYIYGHFTDSCARQLIISNNADGLYKQFIRSFGSKVLQTGHSGYLTIPTEDSNIGWTMKEKITTGIEADHTWVDLGLSVCWATTNVGANSESDCGNYYAWGETSTKSEYNWSTYKYCRGSSTTITKYCTSTNYGTVDNKTLLDLSDDAAHVNWGGMWRMPTYEELNELYTNCTWVWITEYNGYRVTGPNGRFIFLPAAGYNIDRYPSKIGKIGRYWSSSLESSDSACILFFDSNSSLMNHGSIRSAGQSVRPVLSIDSSLL